MFQSILNTLFVITAGGLLQVTCTSPVCPTCECPETGDSATSVPQPETITVRFLNKSDYVLDAQFYSTLIFDENTSIADLASSLFQPTNQVTAGIGLAGQGYIPAGETDTITLGCTEAQAVGTLGGQFLGAEGEVIGTGEQRFAAINLQYGCRDVLTIIYETTEDGFSTMLVAE